MFTRVSSILVVFALVGLFAGCSKSPTTQYDAGQASLDKAREAQADQYAPALLKEATDSLGAAAAEMKKQDERFAVMRDYDHAVAMIAAAQQLADKAVAEAAVEKERVRLEDSTMIDQINGLVTQTKDMLKKAPKGKGSRLDLKVMTADVDAAVATLAMATEDYKAGNYLTAHDKLNAVKAQVGKVKTDIETATGGAKK
jgi:hypothetical protein